ncbi:Oidioi.mRNA.OKI2018_I69.chr2.g5391.t1.cds [Oikopleura dioica]|uniref:Oidioi.mRNA.OKI2018_I69.chr2.g5391.t1.cds n=1 Tax=Oikopleura dioica TaxID=34765 RepID=A0ABN7T060_OIKDI|nr:Oidioi.mRNA.OKI2018_I69.chr2.g5391.t1.cds [Oikopleura dioica]
MRLSDAYVISGDGNSKVSATITAPADNYAEWAQHALIGNQLYIFGGSSDSRKAIDSHSSLQINDSIFLISGYGSDNVERVDMDGDEIKSSEIIGNHSGGQVVPVLFQVSAGFCA